MSTPIQNSTSIIAGAFDPITPTNTQMLKVVDAFVDEADSLAIEAIFGTTKELLTTTQKAQVMNTEVQRWILCKTRDHGARKKKAELQVQVDQAAAAGGVL